MRNVLGCDALAALLHLACDGQQRLQLVRDVSGLKVPLDLIDLFARQISVIGSSDGTRRELLEVLRLLDAGVLDPRIDTVMPLEQARAAQERLARREHYGRILLAP